MAQTLASGVVIPAPGDRISAQGVQEMRTLGASVSTGLALTDLQARARDAELEALIAGMEGMTYVGTWEAGRTYRINDVVTHGGDSWARLTAGATGEPGADPAAWGLVARKGDGGGFGELTETPTPGLWEGVDVGIEARLAAMETTQALLAYRSGERNITAAITSTPPPASGGLLVQRLGREVYPYFDSLTYAEGATSIELGGGAAVFPPGFRPSRTIDLPFPRRLSTPSAGGLRIDASGRAWLYQVQAGYAIRGLLSFPTPDPIPATPPGTPA